MWTREEAIQVLDTMNYIQRDGFVLDFKEAIKIAMNKSQMDRYQEVNRVILQTLLNNRCKLDCIGRLDPPLIEMAYKWLQENPDKPFITKIPWEVRLEEDIQEQQDGGSNP